MESAQFKKKPLRDQLGLCEKYIAEINGQKTKITLSVEKLQVKFDFNDTTFILVKTNIAGLFFCKHNFLPIFLSFPFPFSYVYEGSFPIWHWR